MRDGSSRCYRRGNGRTNSIGEGDHLDLTRVCAGTTSPSLNTNHTTPSRLPTLIPRLETSRSRFCTRIPVYPRRRTSLSFATYRCMSGKDDRSPINDRRLSGDCPLMIDSCSAMKQDSRAVIQEDSRRSSIR